MTITAHMLSIIFGCICGALACAAPIYALIKRDSPRLTMGLLVAIMALPYLLIQGALLVVASRWLDQLLHFGVAAVATYLVVLVGSVLLFFR